jgi:hypothetical protein
VPRAFIAGSGNVNFVKGIEADICPFCKAYERVHGKKAHEKRG